VGCFGFRFADATSPGFKYRCTHNECEIKVAIIHIQIEPHSNGYNICIICTLVHMRTGLCLFVFVGLALIGHRQLNNWIMFI